MIRLAHAAWFVVAVSAASARASSFEILDLRHSIALRAPSEIEGRTDTTWTTGVRADVSLGGWWRIWPYYGAGDNVGTQSVAITSNSILNQGSAATQVIFSYSFADHPLCSTESSAFLRFRLDAPHRCRVTGSVGFEIWFNGIHPNAVVGVGECELGGASGTIWSAVLEGTTDGAAAEPFDTTVNLPPGEYVLRNRTLAAYDCQLWGTVRARFDVTLAFIPRVSVHPATWSQVRSLYR